LPNLKKQAISRFITNLTTGFELVEKNTLIICTLFETKYSFFIYLNDTTTALYVFILNIIANYFLLLKQNDCFIRIYC
jgi:hypothetical protein